MAPVATTPTAADALQERKKILADNAGFVQERDRNQAEAEAWGKVKAALIKEVGSLKGVSEITREVDAHVAGLLSAGRTTKQAELANLDRQIAAKTKTSADLDATIATKTTNMQTLDYHSKFLAEEVVKQTATHNQAKADHEKFLEQSSAEQARINADLETSRKEIAANRKEKEENEARVREEDIRLSTRGADLAIYESRIRRYAAAAGVTLPETI